METAKKSWELSDDFWTRARTLIPQSHRAENRTYKRKPGAGRKPIPQKRVLEGIFHVLKTGIKWKALPKEEFGCPSCIHAYFKKWEEGGLFRKLWEARLVECDEMKGIAWEWIDAGKIADTDSSNPGASQTANAKDIPSKGSWRPIVPRRNRSKHPDQMFFRLVEHASSSPAQSVEAQEKAV